MKNRLGALSAVIVLSAFGSVQAQDLSYEASGAFAEANLAAIDRSGWHVWRIADRGKTTAQTAFDAKYNVVLHPEYMSGTHVDRSRIFLGMSHDGSLVGGLTPFGADVCSADAISRKLSLSAYFGRTLKPIRLGPLERLQYTPAGGAVQTVCFYPFRLSAAEMDRNFAGLGDKDTMRMTVRVDDKIDHSVWTGAKYTPQQSGTGSTSQALTQKQYKGLRAFLAFLPK